MPKGDEGPATIAATTLAFETEAVSRGLRERTVYKYKLLFRQLKEFAAVQGVAHLKQLDVPCFACSAPRGKIAIWRH